MRERRHVLDAALFELGAGNSGNADGKVLSRDFPVAGRYDDLLDAGLVVGYVRCQCRRSVERREYRGRYG